MERLRTPSIEWAIAGRPAIGQQLSGDRGLVRARARRALVAVVDGLGHGPGAAAAAERAVHALQAHADDPVTSLIQRCHEATRDTQGVVLGVATIDIVRGTLSWLGVGNVAGVVVSNGHGYSEQRQALLQRAGIVGAHLPPLAQALVALRPRDVLIVATDGIKMDAHWPITLADPLQTIADRILCEYGLETDDALVVVVRYLGRGGRW